MTGIWDGNLTSDLKKPKDVDLESSKKKTLDALAKWKAADEELTRICEELGLDKPTLIMMG